MFPVLAAAVLYMAKDEMAVVRLFLASVELVFVVKATILIRIPIQELSGIGFMRLVPYMSLWPGMDPSGFGTKVAVPSECGSRFVRGLLATYLGLGSALGIALISPRLGDEALGWCGIATILVIVHFGISEILSSLANLLGFKVGPLFDKPLQSVTLSEFWTTRWNRPFVEMDRILFMRPLARQLGIRGAVFGVFLISGLLHELAISYPAGGGYGGPLIYFAIQGGLILAEKRFEVRSRVLTWITIIGPLPLLFHSTFRATFIVPLFHWANSILLSHTISWYIDKELWILGVMQLLVLMASFQVPTRLRWKEELPKLSSFNRKLMWTNGSFIVLTIISFGVMTLTLHGSFMARETAALGIAVFICVFWVMRLVADGVYYKHEDWPEGPQFVIGHALLDSLFAVLVCGYGSYVLWRVF